MNVQRNICSGVLAAVLLAGSVAVPALAQPADAGAAQTVEVERDDDGFDWGLLGLLGLLGLIPRKRHDTHVHHDTTRPGAR